MPGLKQEKLVVVKLNTQGDETWRYPAVLLQRTDQAALIEAHFNRDDLQFHGILLGRGDRFMEAYFTRRWFNIFEIHDRASDELKGWYCNVTRPAVFIDGRIEYVDLALDLLVYPDGKTLLLDEDEFEELELGAGERRRALAAADELQELFQRNPGRHLAELFAELAKNPPDQPAGQREKSE